MNELKVEYVDINSITPYENNAKQHPPEQIEQIKRSIKEFGFNDPIAVWNGEIVEGHGRLYAAQELGIKTVPIIRLDNLTDEQRRAYALVHNKLTMNSGFDFEMLQMELDSLSFDMDDYGFEQAFKDAEEEIQSREAVGKYEYDDGFRDEQEPLPKDELAKYTENADDYLMRKRVIITYRPEQEDEIRELLGIGEDRIRVVYEIDELIS